jgi:hypothetical protein
MVQVESEAITEIDYDAETSRMFVRFAEGNWYTYFAVPARVHEAFVAASSHGRFFKITFATAIPSVVVARPR